MMNRKSRTFQRIAALLAMILPAGLFLWSRMLLPDPQETLSAAKEAHRQANYELASELVRQISPEAAEYPDAMLLAGEVALEHEDFSGALQCWTQIPRSTDKAGLKLIASIASLRIYTGELQQAISDFQLVLSHQPSNLDAHSRLGFLYAACGRNWSARSHFELLLKSGAATAQELSLFGDLHRPVDEREFLLRCRQQQPDDRDVLLGLAASDLLDGMAESAWSTTLKLHSLFPRDNDVWLLGANILIDYAPDSFPAWHEQLPPQADAHPDVWYLRGRYRQLKNSPAQAAHCYLEALKRSPTHRTACFQLSLVLAELKHQQVAALKSYSAILYQLSEDFKRASDSQGKNPAAVKRIVENLNNTGRIWEACAWAQLARLNFSRPAWSEQTLMSRAGMLNTSLPMVLTEALPISALDAADFPAWRSPTPTAPIPLSISGSQVEPGDTDIMLTENSEAGGIVFGYQNASDLATAGQRMQEQTGGGVGVLDLERDGHPDVILTQGAEWASGSSEPILSDLIIDRVYRNQLGRNFVDVTDECGLHDPYYGQGVAVGDINNDGFDDLFIANIGQNTIWLNHGDGTFTAVPAPDEPLGRWSSSTAIVDINDDGNPDLLDIAYLSGPEVYQLICSGKSCSPAVFSGTPPLLHLSTGTGEFDSLVASVPAENAKGLGLVVYRDPGATSPSILIANDQTPKFLLRYSEVANSPVLTDYAGASGISLNGEGIPTAAMGIATTDLNQDGLQDFFITNFHSEPNSLFLQQAPGFFRDQTRVSGLQSGGLDFVSWGTQFADLDLDGDQDLFVASGHIDDFRPEGGEFAMRPQVFQNLGNLTFRELFFEEAGNSLQDAIHGRGVAILDWNDDGRPDFLVGTSEGPARLFTNSTRTRNRYLKVLLTAQTTQRDAWFATVQVTTSSGVQTQQLTAGNGFHGCSQRALFFGLGDANDIQQLRVTWPSGDESLMQSVPADATLIIAEHHSTALATVGGQSRSLSVTIKSQ